MEEKKADAQHLENVLPTTGKLADVASIDERNSIEDTETGKFVWLVSATASLGGLLFGYDTGVISAVLLYLRADLGHDLLTNEKELITSITSGGGLIGAMAAGLTADKFGRKGAIYMGCVLFFIGAVLQATSFNLIQMTVGRLIVGLGVGSAAMIVPMYVAEIAPAKQRGRLIGLDNMSITGGQVVSYGCGAALAQIPHGWRIMVGLGAVPAIILTGLLTLCPESPRHLIYHGRVTEAASVIHKIFPNGTEDQVQAKIQQITCDVEMAKEIQTGKSLWWLLKQLFIVPSNRRATIVACGIMAFSQFSGFNNLMYYSSTLFALVGFGNPVAVGSIIAGVNFICTCFSVVLVDRAGRRRILLCTVWGMSLFLGIAAAAFHYIPIQPDLTLAPNMTVGWPAYLVLVCLIVFSMFYAVGIGGLSWTCAELFPMEIRSLGTMFMTMCNWAPNIIVASTFLKQMETTTPTGTFAFYAAICGAGWIFIWLCVPEARGLTLENIRELFEDGFGVGKGREMQKELAIRRGTRDSV